LAELIGIRRHDEVVPPRVLLVLPSATYRAPEFLAAAGHLGVEVVTASDAPQALASVMGENFLELDLRHPKDAAEAIAERARSLPIDAVLAVDEQGLEVAALASERLGLRANSPAAVAATRDKVIMRELFALAGVPQPRFAHVDAGADDVEDAVVAHAGEIGYPVVLKPAFGSAASRGVIRCDDAAEARRATQRILEMCASPPGPKAILVESFVPGVEVALEGLLDDGTLRVLALFDKPDPLDGPYFEESIYVTPSRLEPGTQAVIAEAIAAACRALCLREGPIHAEARVTPAGEVVVIENAGRTIGGKCSKALQFSAGATLEEIVLAHALGLEQSGGELTSGATGVLMLPIARSGILRAVRGREDALRVPGVTGLEVSIPIGQPITALPEADRYLGFMFARGEDPASVERALREGLSRLEIEIEAVER
jgi:biotin carboxylase